MTKKARMSVDRSRPRRGRLRPNTVSSGGTWTYTSGNIGLGTYYATAVRTDTAGNTTVTPTFGPFVR